MTEKEIWEYLWDRKISHSKPFDRDFIWIKKADFQAIKSYFQKEFNLLHKEDSFRSLGYISHIHVVDQGDCMLAHKDIGNPKRFLPLGLIHLILDVIPYAIFIKVKRTSMSSILKRPD